MTSYIVNILGQDSREPDEYLLGWYNSNILNPKGYNILELYQTQITQSMDLEDNKDKRKKIPQIQKYK